MSTAHQPNDLALHHLGAFLPPTPSSVAKLLAACDTLQTETHILILDHLCTIDLPAHLAKRVCLRALDSPNTYVRYLASARFHFKVEEAADQAIIEAKIEADPEPYVRYCLLESPQRVGIHGDSLEVAERFFSLPQEARLAMLRNLVGAGKPIGQIVEHALRRRVASDVELLEILCDYVNNPRFQEYHRQIERRDLYNSNVEWETGRELEFLWRLVPLLPNPASRLLIESLPEQARFGFGIPTEALDSLSEEQTIWLLERPDIELKAL